MPTLVGKGGALDDFYNSRLAHGVNRPMSDFVGIATAASARLGASSDSHSNVCNLSIASRALCSRDIVIEVLCLILGVVMASGQGVGCRIVS